MRSYLCLRVTQNGWVYEYYYPNTEQGRRDLKADKRDLKKNKKPSRWALQ